MKTRNNPELLSEDLLDLKPYFTDIMWKRLTAARDNVTSIIVSPTGMDFYTNESGTAILTCIEKGLKVREIIELFIQITKSEEIKDIEDIKNGTIEFLQVLKENNIISLEC